VHPRARRPVPARRAVEAGPLPRQVQGLRLTTHPVGHAHPHLQALIQRARSEAHAGAQRTLGIVYPCDAAALVAAARVVDEGIARPFLIGPREAILHAIATSFRAVPVPVIGRIQDDAFILDLRCLTDEDAFAAQLTQLRYQDVSEKE
jgi:L-seryl-tRNA(Ser) seleniumtransferase